MAKVWQTIFGWVKHNKEWVFSGAGIAVIGSLFSFLRFLWQKKRRPPELIDPPLRVKLAFGFLTCDTPEISDQMLLFTVANPNYDRRVQLTGIRLDLGGGVSVGFPHLEGEGRMPCFIEPGTNVKFWVQLSNVEDALRRRDYTGRVETRAVANDALGNEHSSNPVEIRCLA
jgi:hypothetical protein